MIKRAHIVVQGLVQGVGFRPFVYGLARELALRGTVCNGSEGVSIAVEGAEEHVSAFIRRLSANPPPAAVVRSIQTCFEEPRGVAGFEIVESTRADVLQVIVPPDYALCEDCSREMGDPANRRFRYAFTNCTNCGPRYTIIEDLPYDRARTSMAPFPMCGACLKEYQDPLNRRFHAEATCCPDCGPEMLLVSGGAPRHRGDDAVRAAVGLLEAGQVLAVKGVGGFHLACDASNEEAVAALRRRKHRDLKPFALMVRDQAALERICRTDSGGLRLLAGREKPIVLLRKRKDHGLAETVSPRNAWFGVMFPYTPLHVLLMEGRYPALVMTSGNISDEPIAFEDADARVRLGDMADAFLLHNRRIGIRADDSVARVSGGAPRFLRRSRGYAPFPVSLPCDTTGNEILATGPELSVTVCLTRAGQACLSHHIGDVMNLSAYESYLQAVTVLEKMLGVAPKTVACDLHPGYSTTRHARETGLNLVQVQHHHAHIASVLAEHGRTDRVIGVAYDGFGWGDDGGAWGGELLVCDLAQSRRAGRWCEMPLPGGDITSKKPMRMAYALLRELYGPKADETAAALLPALSRAERHIIAETMAGAAFCPNTSSVGRLFDAASALLGLCSVNTYHAQAPLELEGVAGLVDNDAGWYPLTPHKALGGLWELPGAELLGLLLDDYRHGTNQALCALRFHESVARATVSICRQVRNDTGLGTVALSGGVFMNGILLERTLALLEAAGFEALSNRLVPAGDGGLSLGQAAIAAWRQYVSGHTDADS